MIPLISSTARIIGAWMEREGLTAADMKVTAGQVTLTTHNDRPWLNAIRDLDVPYDLDKDGVLFTYPIKSIQVCVDFHPVDRTETP